MSESHYNYSLDCYLVDEFTEDAVMRIRLFAQHIGKKGRWPSGRPQFVDEVDEASCTQPEDAPIRTAGFVVPLRDPRVGVSPKEDAEDLELVRRVIERLCEFTGALDLTVELQLGGQYAGRIESGRPDRLVTVGIISEWEKSLAERLRPLSTST